VPIRTKRCSGPCGQSYPITHFWSDAGAPDGRMSRCPACEKEARAAAREARERGEREGQPDRNGRVVAFSEEERKRRSELAKRLHAEGRFGGAVIRGTGSQSPRRHRIADAVLDNFRQPDEQKLVINAYRSALKGKNKALRVRAADAVLRIDAQVAERERADRGGAVDPASMTQEELQEFVAQGLEAMMARGEISLADVELGEDAVEDVT
jgi:hypothetical protein